MEKKSFKLIDDVDGVSPAAETVQFGIDNVAYEIDLTDAHATELRDLIDTWALYGRRVRPASSNSAPKTVSHVDDFASFLKQVSAAARVRKPR